ncbi:MAG: hypothetical protein HGB17_04175 [Syntrophobacteraceae bacterium]|nr:hypothetical protein [Syntrophobacteraceae bacterium]
MNKVVVAADADQVTVLAAAKADPKVAPYLDGKTIGVWVNLVGFDLIEDLLGDAQGKLNADGLATMATTSSRNRDLSPPPMMNHSTSPWATREATGTTSILRVSSRS